MSMTATQLRKRLYEVLHGIEKTGEPVEIELKNARFIISRAARREAVGRA
jgi:PHD/YefM family antitoxin component YafN of YafNO toxin-antitoxin module